MSYRRKNIWKDLEAAGSEGISGQERCIKQLALSAVRNVKFHSSQQKASQFIAEIAIAKEEEFNSLSIKV